MRPLMDRRKKALVAILAFLVMFVLVWQNTPQVERVENKMSWTMKDVWPHPLTADGWVERRNAEGRLIENTPFHLVLLPILENEWCENEWWRGEGAEVNRHA